MTRKSFGLATILLTVCGAWPVPAEDAATPVPDDLSQKVAVIIASSSNDPWTTADADKFIKDLMALGPRAVPAILKGLEQAASQQSILTGPMITVLVRLKAVESAPLLLKLAKESPLPNIRGDALQALAAFKQRASVPPLMDLLASTVPNKGAATTAMLESRGKIAETLIALNQDYTCSHASLEAMDLSAGNAGDELKLQWVYILQHGSYRSTEIGLLKLTQDRCPSVVAAAVDALGQAG
jgi:hypothetical protein